MASNLQPVTLDTSVAYIDGHVYTVDEAKPWAEAFIVSPGGIFTAVGATKEIEMRAKAENLLIIDLAGTFVMPGIHDAHVHTFHSGLHMLNDTVMDFSTDSSNLAERLKMSCGSCVQDHGCSDWLVGVLFQIEEYDRAMLDGTWPDRPVLIHGSGGHVKYLNTKGLERAGFDIQSEGDDEHSVLPRRPDGSLTGIIAGQKAMGRANMAVPRPTLSHLKKALRSAVKELHRNGVTYVQEAAANRLLLEALNELDNDGQLQMGYAAHILFRNEWLSGEVRENVEDVVKLSDQYPSMHVDTRFAKLMMDGIPGVPVPTHSQLDENGSPDMSKILEKSLPDVIAALDRRDISCKIHCMGQGATKLALDAFAAVRNLNPNGPQHEIAHCSGVQYDDFSRFRQLNVTAEMSPAMFFQSMGPEMQVGYDFKKMSQEGNLITIGSDWAFGMRLPLLQSVAHLVPDIGIEAILQMLTLNGAKSVGKENELGTITVGKKASFITVDRDLTKGDLANAYITKTWFEGKLVFDSCEKSN